MGFSSHASKVVKINRALLKKRKIRTKADVYGNPVETTLEFKPESPHSKRRVKEMIQDNRKTNLAAGLMAFLIVLLFLISIVLYLK